MICLIIVIGFIYGGVLASESPSEFEDVMSILNNKYSSSNNLHKYKKAKMPNNHETFEMSFPLFSDIFPLNAFDNKPKDIFKNFQEDKESMLDNAEQPKFIKPQRKGKDKFIMSLTEFFIPIMNHKNIDMGIPKKFDIFDEFFKDFPLRDSDETPIFHRHKISKKNLNYIPFINSNLSQATTDYYLLDYTTHRNYLLNKKIENGTQSKYNLLYEGSPRTMFIPNSDNETGNIPLCCAGHPECKMKLHCQQGMCQDDKHENSIEVQDMSKMSDMVNISKLSRNILFYTVPILIGVGGIIVAIEVVRKHNGMMRQAQYLKEYDAVQRC